MTSEQATIQSVSQPNSKPLTGIYRQSERNFIGSRFVGHL